MTAYRRAVLLMGGAGIFAVAAAGLLTWPAAVVIAVALLAAAATSRARFAVAPAAVVLLVATGTSSIQGYDRSPSVVAAGLVLVLLVIAARSPRRPELDAALVAAIGLAVVTASATVTRGPAGPLALSAVLLVAALWYRQRALAGHPPRRPQRRVPKAMVATFAAVAALGLLAAPAPASTGLHSSLFGRHGGSGGGPGTIDPATYSTSTLSLDVRGRLSLNPVLSVPADSPELWRGNVYARYDGHSWTIPTSAKAPTPAAPRVSGRGFRAVATTVAVTPADLDPLPPTAPVTVTATTLGGSAFDGTVYAPGVVTAIRATTQLLPGSPGASHLRDPVGYSVTVREPVTDPTRLAGATGGDPAGWTQVPAELPTRVDELAAQVTGQAQTRPAKVAAVETYLRAHERYTLAAPVPAAGRDSVDAFLFGSHEGFCEQFASAEVIMLRSVGIPARLATGFAYGDPAYSSADHRVFSEADAHAWVEVSYPGLGWSPSDPTAGSQLVAARTGVTAQLTALIGRIGHSPRLRALTAGVLAVVALAALGLWMLGRRGLGTRRRRRRLPPVAAAFSRLQRRFPRVAGSTPREWFATLPPPLPTVLAPAAATWQRELFAAGPVTATEAAGAVREVRAAARRRRRRVTNPRSRARP